MKDMTNVFHVDHQPGNATKYDIYLIPLGGNEWLVAVPNFNKSLIVSDLSLISAGYVHEKLNNKPEVGIVDASEIAKVIARQIGTEWMGCTDEKGHYAPEPGPAPDAG